VTLRRTLGFGMERFQRKEFIHYASPRPQCAQRRLGPSYRDAPVTLRASLAAGELRPPPAFS
jgi:hypothetical protein